MSSLGEEFPKEQARVRELLVEYKKLGAVGVFGAQMIEMALRRADNAAMSGDVARMIVAYKELRECE
jgi:hypothetical protein